MWVASPDHASVRVYDGYVDDAAWTVDGTSLLFTSEATLYRADGPEYQPVTLAGPIPGIDPYDQAEIAWIMP